MTFEPRRRNDGKKVDGQENTDRSHDRARQAGDEKPDERHGDDHRAGSDHGDGDGVEELVLVEPAELLHHALLQKRNDCQAAAEHKSAGLREKYQDLGEYVLAIRRGSGLPDPSFEQPDGRSQDQRCADHQHPELPARPSPREQNHQAGKDKELRKLRLRPDGHTP